MDSTKLSGISSTVFSPYITPIYVENVLNLVFSEKYPQKSSKIIKNTPNPPTFLPYFNTMPYI